MYVFLAVSLSLSGFSIKILHAFLFSPFCATSHPPYIVGIMHISCMVQKDVNISVVACVPLAHRFLHAVGLVIIRPTNCKWNAVQLNPTMRNILMQVSFK
jgi:hypothetical protein